MDGYEWINGDGNVTLANGCVHLPVYLGCLTIAYNVFDVTGFGLDAIQYDVL